MFVSLGGFLEFYRTPNVLSECMNRALWCLFWYVNLFDCIFTHCLPFSSHPLFESSLHPLFESSLWRHLFSWTGEKGHFDWFLECSEFSKLLSWSTHEFGKLLCTYFNVVNATIVNRGEWLGSPIIANKQRGKQRGQDSYRKVHDSAHLLFCTHTLCMNYVIAMFLLVSCMNTRNHLLYLVRFCARSAPKIAKQKPITKNIAGLHNHFSLLTMIQQ